jgi:hypothetical protein
MPLDLNKRRNMILWVLGAACVLAGAVIWWLKPRTQQWPPPDRRGAEMAAREWLDLIDRGDFSRAWSSSSKATKSMYDSKTFVDLMGFQMRPLGAPVNRIVESVRSTTVLPSGMTGDFQVFTYRTTFANRTVLQGVIVVDDGGAWRVHHHSIGPRQP